MGNKKVMLILIVLFCFFISGCEKDQQSGILDDSVISISENSGVTEILNIAISEDTEVADTMGISGKDMTIISILGKTEIAIESDRIHDKIDAVDHLNNLFTLDEINIILNTIKGTWKADEYVGFVSYDMCGRGRWLEGVDAYNKYEGDSGWAQYQEAQVQARDNIPDFTISVKEYDTAFDGVVDVENNYIFVRSDDGRIYSSPMSIVLSMTLADDDYPLFINRTMVGIGSNDNYPVIYIQFFTICNSGIEDTIFYEEKIIYEPTTLVLTSDGQFLLLKDGAFYTLRKLNID